MSLIIRIASKKVKHKLDFALNNIKLKPHKTANQPYSNVKFQTRILAFFCGVMFTVGSGCTTSTLFAENLLSRYVSRLAADRAFADSLFGYSTSTRRVIHLNGVWQARQKGEAEWKIVTVPGAYEFDGVVEFRRTFLLDSTLVGKAVKLVVLGINNRCSVQINHSFVGEHSGGHTSFVLEIPNEKLWPDSENEIHITVDNSLLPRGSLPLRHRPHFPFNFGGIFRDIFLQITPTLSIEDVQVAKTFTEDFTGCTLAVTAQINNRLRGFSDEPLIWRVEILDNSGKSLANAQVETPAFDSGLARVNVKIELSKIAQSQLWAPENPVLSRLRSHLSRGDKILDEVIYAIGFSELQATPNGFRLNGQPYQLMGFDWFETSTESGAVAGAAAIKRELLAMKESGANCVRVVGVPPHPALLTACDEIGLLVFQELPLIMTPDHFFANSHFEKLSETYLEEMVKRDGLHVSMAGWGLGADLMTDRPSTAGHVNDLIALVRSRSPLPVYLSFRFLKKIAAIPPVDFLLVEAYNRSAETALEFLNSLQSVAGDDPVALSLGFPVMNVEQRGGFDGKSNSAEVTPPSVRSQQHHAELLRRTLARIDSSGRAAGIFIHTFSDWREASPNLILAGENRPDVHRSGVVAAGGEKRLAHEIARAFFAHQAVKPFSTLAINTHYPIVYPLTGLAILLIFLFNLNRDNRFRGSLRRVFLYSHGFHMELRERRKAPFFHTALLNFVVCTLLSIIVSSTAYHFRNDLLFDSILNFLAPSYSLKLIIIRLIWNPVLFVLIFFLVLNLLQAIVVVFLKILDAVIGEGLPFTQFYTMIVWDSANFLWLLPIVPIYYRIIVQTSWGAYAILLVLLFCFWTMMRLFRGMRVIYNLTFFKGVFMIGLLGMLILGGGWWYIDKHYAWFDYLSFYRQAW